MRAMKLLVAGVVGLAGVALVGAPADAASKPSVDETRSVTVPLRVEKKLRATPIEGGTSYYCAVGNFASFNDLDGWKPVRVEFVYIGSPSSELIGDPPYDDNSSMDGIAFPPVGAQHQTQIGDYGYSQGGFASPEAAEANCEALRQTSDNFFGPDATVVYEHTDKCKTAITKLDAAKKKLKAAKKKLDNAQGPAVAPAQAAYKDAKAKYKKAKKKYKKTCK